MPIIKVVKPFGLRLGSGREVQHFGIGEHFVSDEEFDHWFVQACLKDGRAALVPETVEASEPEGSGEEQPPAGGDVAPETGEAVAPGADTDADPNAPAADGDGVDEGSDEPGDEPASPTREELMALTVPQLKEVAARCGLPLASNATKAVIVDALLASQRSQ